MGKLEIGKRNSFSSAQHFVVWQHAVINSGALRNALLYASQKHSPLANRIFQYISCVLDVDPKSGVRPKLPDREDVIEDAHLDLAAEEVVNEVMNLLLEPLHPERWPDRVDGYSYPRLQTELEPVSKVLFMHVPEESLVRKVVSAGWGIQSEFLTGGEALLLGPAWFASAYDLMTGAAEARGCQFRHYLQTNLIGYGPQWNGVIRTMFGGTLGTSMDVPNDHRRLKNGSREQYTQAWLDAVSRARDAGLGVSVIAVVHSGSLRIGAGEFLRFFAECARIDDVQLNLPFPGGPGRWVPYGTSFSLRRERMISET